MDTNNKEKLNTSESQIDAQIKNLGNEPVKTVPDLVESTLSVDEVDLNLEEEMDSESSVSMVKNYSTLNKSDLLKELDRILTTQPIEAIRREVEVIKKCFYNLHNEEVEAYDKANAEIENEGEVVPFFDKVEKDFGALIAKYKQSRGAYIRSVEDQKEFNYQTKLQIIEELKELLNEEESLNQTFTKFHDIQNRWRVIGQVPQTRIKDIWDTYHHNVEKFYDYVKINKELRDLDLKRNLDVKKVLIEKATQLLDHHSVNEAFTSLQKLHNSWRETGPVPREFKDSLWDTFKDLTGQINKKYQAYFEQRKEEQAQNLQLKEKLCERMEVLAATPGSSVKDWQNKSDELVTLQEEWKGIGFVPKKENNEVYARFKAQRDIFFHNRRAYYKLLKTENNASLKLKKQLCEQAEALMNSEEWKETSDILIKLQKDWKESGHISRKISDELWKRFRGACDAFFERKAAHFSEKDGEHAGNLAAKETLIDEITAFVLGEDREANFEKLKEFQNRWRSIGFVPMRDKNKIQKRYQDSIDAQYTLLKSSGNSERSERNDRNERPERNDRNDRKPRREHRGDFQKSDRGSDRAPRSEKDRLLNKIQQLESDINLWENNIGFFAKSKNADKMIADVQSRIETAHIEIAEITEKIKALDQSEA